MGNFKLRSLLAAVLMLFSIYVLSIGLSARVLRKWYRPRWADEVYRKVYWPIGLACRHSSTAATITGCYIHLWVDVDPMYPPLGRD